ncbi:MAG: TonB-dependent receptor plug domain-containing protein, partial [Burkholderiales bacterium]|nr:TonB-dependent receptor plug domain-containing protein [Burkholderiales bacterium]
MNASFQRRHSPRALLQSTPIAAAVALLLIGNAQAQQAADADQKTDQASQTITVTGIRRGIESSISTKKNSDSVVESVSAEDIGKLPDVSIAESIARLPGVTAQRVNGRANGISVRGFAPDFSTALLNGREQVSTGDSRYVEFDQYPSELMSQVTIYKTPDASLVGQGLSATVDMRTVRPIDYNARAFAINFRHEQLGKGLSTPAGNGSRFNVSYIDQFAGKTLGLSIGYARLTETTGVSQNYGSWGTTGVTLNGVTATAPGGFNDLVDQTKQTRDAVMATLQYKPNKNFQSTLDVFYTKFDQNLLEQGVQVPLAYGQNFAPDTFSAGTASGGNWVTGTYTNAKPLSRNDSTATHDKVHSIGWNNQATFGDWSGALDLATSEAKRQAANVQTTASLVGNCNTTPSACGSVSWTGFNGNVNSAAYTASPALTTSANMLTDSEGWGGNITNGVSSTPQAGYSSQPMTDDKLNQFRVNAKRNLPEGLFFSDVDFGLNYSDRSKTRTYIEGRLLVGSSGNPFAAAAVPGGATAVAPFSGLPYLAWNPDGSIGSIYTVASKLVSDIANKNWKVTEKVTTAFTRLDIDSTLMGIPVRGNAGVQLVHTDQGSDAYQ